jgi:hypothetical protein
LFGFKERPRWRAFIVNSREGTCVGALLQKVEGLGWGRGGWGVEIDCVLKTCGFCGCLVQFQKLNSFFREDKRQQEERASGKSRSGGGHH